jgi:hypothetical protein
MAIAASGIIFFSVSNVFCRDHGEAPLLSLNISLPLSPHFVTVVLTVPRINSS